MPTSNEIYEKVREILVDALGADESECTMDATLMGDLGAESIDFLDIVFRLEKTFNVKIPRGELFPDNFAASDPSLTKDGVLTPTGVAEFDRRMATFDPALPRPRFVPALLRLTMHLLRDSRERRPRRAVERTRHADRRAVTVTRGAPQPQPVRYRRPV